MHGRNTQQYTGSSLESPRMATRTNDFAEVSGPMFLALVVIKTKTNLYPHDLAQGLA